MASPMLDYAAGSQRTPRWRLWPAIALLVTGATSLALASHDPAHSHGLSYAAILSAIGASLAAASLIVSRTQRAVVGCLVGVFAVAEALQGYRFLTTVPRYSLAPTFDQVRDLHMRYLSLALVSYASFHHGAFPSDLDKLLSDATARNVVDDSLTPLVKGDLYLYFAASGVDGVDEGHRVIAMERPQPTMQRVFVCYADGSVVSIPCREAETLAQYKKQKAASTVPASSEAAQ